MCYFILIGQNFRDVTTGEVRTKACKVIELLMLRSKRSCRSIHTSCSKVLQSASVVHLFRGLVFSTRQFRISLMAAITKRLDIVCCQILSVLSLLRMQPLYFLGIMFGGVGFPRLACRIRFNTLALLRCVITIGIMRILIIHVRFSTGCVDIVSLPQTKRNVFGGASSATSRSRRPAVWGTSTASARGYGAAAVCGEDFTLRAHAAPYTYTTHAQVSVSRGADKDETSIACMYDCWLRQQHILKLKVGGKVEGRYRED